MASGLWGSINGDQHQKKENTDTLAERHSQLTLEPVAVSHRMRLALTVSRGVPSLAPSRPRACMALAASATETTRGATR